MQRQKPAWWTPVIDKFREAAMWKAEKVLPSKRRMRLLFWMSCVLCHQIFFWSYTAMEAPAESEIREKRGRQPIQMERTTESREKERQKETKTDRTEQNRQNKWRETEREREREKRKEKKEWSKYNKMSFLVYFGSSYFLQPPQKPTKREQLAKNSCFQNKLVSGYSQIYCTFKGKTSDRFKVSS